jgi:hypothetical protein
LIQRFAKPRQREVSEATKKLDEPVSTAPSGLFPATKRFLILRAHTILIFLIPDAITAL